MRMPNRPHKGRAASMAECVRDVQVIIRNKRQLRIIRLYQKRSFTINEVGRLNIGLIEVLR